MNFAEIDAARVRAGVSISELTRRSGVAWSTYWFIRTGRSVPTRRTLDRYSAALTAPGTKRKPKPENQVGLTAYRGHLALLAQKFGFDPAEVAAKPNARRFWKVRALAIYCTSVEFNIRGADLGRAIGESKQLVSWNLKEAEDMRDDPAIDALVESVGRLIAARDEP